MTPEWSKIVYYDCMKVNVKCSSLESHETKRRLSLSYVWYKDDVTGGINMPSPSHERTNTAECNNSTEPTTLEVIY